MEPLLFGCRLYSATGILPPVSEVTRIPNAVQQGDPKAAEELIPLVYEQLRKLAAHKMANEAPGQTLQPTALVHEAWLRLVGRDEPARFQNRAHFFGAAAEAMRRILIERARRRKVLEKGGFVTPEECTESKLRYFVGMSMPEAAEALGMPLRSAERLWTFARAWLRHEIRES